MKLIIFKDGNMSLRDNNSVLLHNGEPEIEKEVDLSTLTKEDLGVVVDNLGDKDKINEVLAKYNLVI